MSSEEIGARLLMNAERMIFARLSLHDSRYDVDSALPGTVDSALPGTAETAGFACLPTPRYASESGQDPDLAYSSNYPGMQRLTPPAVVAETGAFGDFF